MHGIYGYFDKNKKCVYVGIDKHIEKDKRHQQHKDNLFLDIDAWIRDNEYHYFRLIGPQGIFIDGEVKDKQLNLLLETILIDCLKPELNVKKNKKD